jgi:general secretion pathway protein L
MAIVLNNKIQYWKDRIAHGPAAAFCRWWFGELKQLLPSSWQQRLQQAWRRVMVVHEAEQLRLGIEENQKLHWLESFPLQQDAALQRRQIHALLDKHDVLEASRFLLLHQADVLRKELSLPAAAEPNLQQVLAFEMDRQTPFRAADVYYTWRTRGSDKESGQIHVELIVVPRRSIDASLEAMNVRGLAAGGVDVVDDGRTLGINLLPPEKRFRSVSPQTRLNFVLAAAALVLLIMVMAQSLQYRADRVDGLESAIAEVQDEAKRVQRLREQVGETSEAASFLTRRRAESPMAIELLADVTKILPDDTYLDRLVISQDGVQMQGKSSNAQQLIEVVNKSETFDDAAFRGSTRLDAATGLEIFEISAQVASGGAP